MSQRLRAARIAALASASLLAYALGNRLALRSSGAADGTRPEEARALDRVLPKAVARVAPSLLAVHPASGGDLARKTRSAVALAPDLAVMDALSIAVTGVDDLVVEDAAGKTRAARVRGRDMRLRLVLLEVPDKGLVPAPISGRVAAPGTYVLAVGSVYGSPAHPGASLGIVSAVGRFDGRALQIDCAVDPANAGGALVDLDGALVGIPVLVDRKLGDDSGVAFAVPYAKIVPALPRLRAGDQLEPGFLGIALPKDDPAVAPSLEGGVRVEGVLPSGAASTAGMKTEDVIIRVDGQRVRGVKAFVNALAEKAAGDQVSIVVLRAGVEVPLQVKLGARK